MKKLLNIALFAWAGLALTACEQEHIDAQYIPGKVVAPVAGEVTGAGALTADSPDITMAYTKADLSQLGFSAAAKYTLYAALDEAMTDRQAVKAAFGDSEATITAKDLNFALINAGCEPGVETDVYLQIAVAMLTDKGAEVEGTEVLSDIVSARFASYNAVFYPASIGVTGDFGNIGWAPAKAPQLWGDADKGTYWGYVAMYGKDEHEFKFTYEDTWLGGASTDGTAYTLGGGSNMKIAKGLYRWDVDLAGQTAKATPLTKVGLIGDGVGGWDTDHAELVRDSEDGLYKASGITTSDGEFKVRFNGGWDDNLGGDPNDLTINGANIKITAGTYDFVLDLTHTPYKITFTVSD